MAFAELTHHACKLPKILLQLTGLIHNEYTVPVCIRNSVFNKTLQNILMKVVVFFACSAHEVSPAIWLVKPKVLFPSQLLKLANLQSDLCHCSHKQLFFCVTFFFRLSFLDIGVFHLFRPSLLDQLCSRLIHEQGTFQPYVNVNHIYSGHALSYTSTKLS